MTDAPTAPTSRRLVVVIRQRVNEALTEFRTRHELPSDTATVEAMILHAQEVDDVLRAGGKIIGADGVPVRLVVT